MEAGKLRHRVTFQAPTPSSDEYGRGGAPTWSDLDTVFARVRPLRAGEVLRGQQTKSDTTCIITIRTLPGLTTDCRALWQGQYLYINGIIDPEGRGIEMEIMCRGEH